MRIDPGDRAVQRLANDVVKLLKREDDRAIVGAALALVLAAWLVRSGYESDDDENMQMLAVQAKIIAPTLRAAMDEGGMDAVKDRLIRTADEQLRQLADEIATKHVESLPTAKVKKGPSPWGNVR